MPSPSNMNPNLLIRYELGQNKQLIRTVEENGVGITSQTYIHESKGPRLIKEKLMALPGYTEDSLSITSGPWGTKVEVKIFHSSLKR